jgi:hypothetical protein
MTTRDGTPTLLLYPSGIFFNPIEPDPSKIHVPDIAHALAAIPRFGGHTVEPYSVAQHSVLVSRIIEAHCLPSIGSVYRTWALWGLLHEVAEALSGFGDVCGPVKRLRHVAAVVKPIERAIEAAAATRWGFPADFASYPIVKAADRYVLDWEDRDLRWENAPSHLGTVPRTWRPEDLGPPVAGADVVLPKERIVVWPFAVARECFLARYAELMSPSLAVTPTDIIRRSGPVAEAPPFPEDMAEAAGFPRAALAFGIGVETERVRTGLLPDSAPFPAAWAPPALPDPGAMAAEYGWEQESGARRCFIGGVVAERKRVAT